MKPVPIAVAVLILIVVVIGAFFLIRTKSSAPAPVATTTPNGVTTTTTTSQSVTSPQGVGFNFATPYGLAINPTQILVRTVIPPCDLGFSYCVYRVSNAEYADTNFESAGIAITNRTNLATKDACLNTQPEGYSGLHATTSEQSGYATSVFSPIQNGAAGHTSTGAEYRLYFNGTCYQFETRIGETQFGNFPTGTKTKFSDANRATVMGELRAILANVTLNGSKVVFP